MFDSVYALAKGIHALQKSLPRSILRSSNASCDTEVPWMDGSSLYNYINSVSLAPATSFVMRLSSCHDLVMRVWWNFDCICGQGESEGRERARLAVISAVIWAVDNLLDSFMLAPYPMQNKSSTYNTNDNGRGLWVRREVIWSVPGSLPCNLLLVLCIRALYPCFVLAFCTE